jgi:glycine cleavage system H protein
MVPEEKARTELQDAEYLQVTVGKFIFRVREGCLYTDAGLWVSRDAGTGRTRVGLSDFRQQSSGDVAFVELPAVGAAAKREEELASVETVKVDLEVPAPFDATVAAVNEALAGEPELINQDPYGAGWLIDLEPAAWPVTGLLDAATYLAVMTAQAEEASR